MAEIYLSAAHELTDRNKPHLSIPSTMLAALSFELHLKCLVTMGGHDTPRGHDLGKLFREVSPESQAWIRDYFEKHGAEARRLFREGWGKIGSDHADLTFDYVLERSQKWFERARYLYEDQARGLGFLARDIHSGARKRIFELRPEWTKAK